MPLEQILKQRQQRPIIMNIRSATENLMLQNGTLKRLFD